MGRKLWIDTDVLVYEAAGAAQRTIYTYEGRDFYTYKAFEDWAKDNEVDAKAARKSGACSSRIEVMPEATAARIADKKLQDILATCGSDSYELVMSGTDNFRDAVGVTKGYKANRKDTVKPAHYEFCRLHYMRNPRLVMVNGMEADDYISISLYEDTEGVVCTIDKDLNQIVGRHYDWNKGLKYKVDEANAQRWFLRQMLTGDSTDNVPGLPGWGDAKATNAIEPVRNNIPGMWAVVKAAYAKGPFKFKDGTKTPDDNQAYLTEQMQLLWMMREPDQRLTPQEYEDKYVK